MKYIISLFCLLLFVLKSPNAFTKQKYTYPLSKLETEQNINKRFETSIKLEKENLSLAKIFIINGQLELAKKVLTESFFTSEESKVTSTRYLATVHFLLNDHKKVTQLLNNKEMNESGVIAKFCIINLISMMIINKDSSSIKNQWRNCRSAALKYSKNNMTWVQTLVALKTVSDENQIKALLNDLSVDNLDQEYLRIYLKLALYINKEDKIIERFKYFSSDILLNTEIRELIGINYLRNLDLKNAYDLLSDMDRPNANIFKGNLLLAQKKYDLAFAQFKIALQQKETSKNALERLIPLTWLLGLWDEGSQYTENMLVNNQERAQKMTLKSAFLTMSNKHKESEKLIKNLRKINHENDPVELLEILTLNSLHLGKVDQTIRSAMSSCLKKDIINCWLLFYIHGWDEQIELITTDHDLHKGTQSLLDLYTKNEINNPLIEEVFVNQKDVEELDNALIDLLPSK